MLAVCEGEGAKVSGLRSTGEPLRPVREKAEGGDPSRSGDGAETASGPFPGGDDAAGEGAAGAADWAALLLAGGEARVSYDKAREAGEILQRIYDSETAGALRWFFDAGFEWEAWGRSDLDEGDDGHGLALIDAVLGMAEIVAKRSPEGEFARWWQGR